MSSSDDRIVSIEEAVLRLTQRVERLENRVMYLADVVSQIPPSDSMQSRTYAVMLTYLMAGLQRGEMPSALELKMLGRQVMSATEAVLQGMSATDAVESPPVEDN